MVTARPSLLAKPEPEPADRPIAKWLRHFDSSVIAVARPSKAGMKDIPTTLISADEKSTPTIPIRNATSASAWIPRTCAWLVPRASGAIPEPPAPNARTVPPPRSATPSTCMGNPARSAKRANSSATPIGVQYLSVSLGVRPQTCRCRPAPALPPAAQPHAIEKNQPTPQPVVVI
jgi:hypothetical protein